MLPFIFPINLSDPCQIMAVIIFDKIYELGTRFFFLIQFYTSKNMLNHLTVIRDTNVWALLYFN